MTIAVVDTPVTAAPYSAPSAVTPISLRPLDQANQRLENEDGDKFQRISTSMRSAVRMESPRSVSTKDPIVCECMRVQRSALINAMEAGCHTIQALSMRTGAGATCGGCLPRLPEPPPANALQTGDCPGVDRSRPPGELLSFRGAVLSRRRSDPTGATPCCPGDYRRC